jgi:AraC-like DNA-binding protein
MAKIMLVSTLDSITVIAEKTGFNSYSYFIELFKNRVGISPLKYRKSNAL